MEDWLKTRLSACLDFEVPDEMISYILELKIQQELDDYFATLLNFELAEHRLFINDFKQRVLKKNVLVNSNNKNKRQPVKIEKNLPPKNEKPIKQKTPPQEEKTGSTIKKKNKYVNLYQKDGQLADVVLLKGRHRCDCQASKHKLINNCMKCGRIICEQEGSGPCLYCGNLVCSDEEIKIIESSTKKGDHLKKTLTEQGRPKGWIEAMAQRNRLLEYDRTSEKRTTIIDDESDYFKTNSVWLSDAERKKLEKIENEVRDKKHSSRLNKKITLDFAGRKIIEEDKISAEYEREILQEISQTSTTNYQQNKLVYDQTDSEALGDRIHPLHEGPIPIFDNSVVIRNQFNTVPKYDGVYSKVQDKEYLEISDMRSCMSMHQPWASLLVSGIKKHEGRTWYSSHRGRLWIAATAKPVDMDEVKRMENFYRVYYKDETIEFPTQYPSGCLLGCVLVQDCLQQEEYRKVYPEGESESPFVFVCTDSQELSVRFPVKGQHKIYKLDPSIHQAAVKSLQRLAHNRAKEE